MSQYYVCMYWYSYRYCNRLLLATCYLLPTFASHSPLATRYKFQVQVPGTSGLLEIGAGDYKLQVQVQVAGLTFKPYGIWSTGKPGSS
jgi:hypothetical protein